MSNAVNYKMWTVCMIQKEDKVLLLDRQHDDFQGFIPPGSKVEFPESIVESAVREVKEETGLDVSNLVFKGLYEYVNPVAMDRHMIFNYITKDFKEELLEDGTFEIQVEWNHAEDKEGKVTIKRT